MIRPALTTAAILLALTAGGEPPSPSNPQPAAAAQAPSEPAAPTWPGAPPSGPFAATPASGEELPTSKTTPAPIPLAYRHLWAIDPVDCAKQTGLTRIDIAPGTIRFYEGRSVVKSAQAEGPNKLLLDITHIGRGDAS